MFIGWLPIAVAGLSAVSSIFGGGSRSSQAAAQKRSLQQQIEIEQENYELLQDTRKWQSFEQSFQNQREKFALQTQKRGLLLNSRLQAAQGKLGLKQQRGQLNLAEQQLPIAEQELRQQLGVEGQELGQIQQQLGQEGAQALAQIPRTQSAFDDSLQGLANLEAAAVARQDVLGDVLSRQGSLNAQLAQNQAHTNSVFGLQQASQRATIQNQRESLTQSLRALNQAAQFDRSLVRVQHRGSQLARRAERLHQKALTKNQAVADRLSHQTRTTQLQGAMPTSPSNVQNIIGGLGGIASAAIGSGLFGGSRATPNVPSAVSALAGGTGTLSAGLSTNTQPTATVGGGALGLGVGASAIRPQFSGFPTAFSNVG